MMGTIMSSNRKIVLTLAGIAAAVAVVRYFLKGWLEPLGVPTFVGSFLASVTIVLLVGLVLLFLREGRSDEGRYIRAAAWFIAFSVWCEVLVITGILLTERTGASTYYQGPWKMVETMFPTPAAHAIGHTQGFVVRLAVNLIIGAVIYWFAKGRRAKTRNNAEAPVASRA
ncbi:MAG TPA: hypothetical protein VK747_21075 [Blastocatellia bacterium]|nr:hypothetical protein [Blastocatellia bacterium]